jgi:hypothetical protein
MNIAKVNGIDEFNSPRSWKCANKNANKTLDRVNKFIASGYLIEFTRREQFRKVPTTSFETDTEKFFIAVNREPITSVRHSLDGESESYDEGEVSEIGFGNVGDYIVYQTVEGVINGASCYNLRHSPFEAAMCWADFLGITQAVWTLAKSEGNISMKKWYNEIPSQIEYPNPSYPTFGFYEYDNIDSGLRDRLLFGQLNAEFEIPMDFETFNYLINNSQEKINYFCGDNSGTPASGWIASIKYRPNVDGMALIKLNIE